MLRRGGKLCLELLIGLMSLALLAGVSFLGWVIAEPRNVPAITSYAEGTLNSISPNLHFEINNSTIQWDSWNQMISIHIKDVTVTNDTNDILAELPEVALGINLLKVFQGKALFSNLTIYKPLFNINSKELARSYGPESQHGFLDIIRKAPTLPLSLIRVKESEIHIQTVNSNVVWQIPEGYIRLDYANIRHSRPALYSEFTLDFGKTKSHLKAQAYEGRDNVIRAEVNFLDLPSFAFSDIFPELAVLQNVDLIGKGSLSAESDMETNVISLGFNIAEMTGYVDVPGHFQSPLLLSSFNAIGKVTNNFSQLELEEAHLTSGDTKISLKGEAKNTEALPHIAPDITFSTEISGLPVKDIKEYWPIQFFSPVREWVISHVTKGIIEKAEGSFHFTPDTFAQGILPEKSIDAKIHVKNGEFSYAEHHPHITQANGTVSFTEKGMHIELTQAKNKDSTLTNGTINLDFLQSPFILTTTGKAQGPFKNVLDFIPENTVRSTAFALKKAEGKATTSFEVSLPIQADLSPADVAYAVDLQLTDFSLPSVLKNIDAKDAKLQVKVKPNILSLEGTAAFNGTPLNITYKNVTDTPETYRISGDIPANALPSLGLEQLSPYVSDGAVRLTLDSEIKWHRHHMKGEIDLTPATFTFSTLALEKMKSTPGNILFTALYTPNETININSFAYQSEKNLIQGSATFDIKTTSVTAATIPLLRFAGNHFGLDYKQDKKKDIWNIKGKSIDLSQVSFSKLLSSSEAEKRARNVHIELEKAYMKNGNQFLNISGDIACGTVICNQINLYTKFSDNHYALMNVKHISKNKRSLIIESDDAGTFLKAFDFTTHINGGMFEVNGTMDKTGNTSYTEGIAKIHDFRVVQTSPIARLLTLASIKGIGELIEGKGIHFKKFEAPFTMQGGIVTLKNAVSSGASVGITAEGSIDTNQSYIDISGLVVPAHAINTFLQKVPVVGELVIGKEGEGIIATRYQIKGPYETAEVTVNPLSMITPGVLRNIFDFFPDTLVPGVGVPEKTKEKPAEESTPAPIEKR